MIIDPEFKKFIQEERIRFRNDAVIADKLLNNILLLVTTGAFALSVNFFINKIDSLHCVVLLKLAWICLGLSIILNSLGYFISRNQNENHVKYLDNKISIFTQIFSGPDYDGNSDKHFNSKDNKTIFLLNSSCFFSFIIGLFLLIIFVILQV